MGSLRAGGASWLLAVSEDSGMVGRGRWINSKVMEVYAQEVSSVQFLRKASAFLLLLKQAAYFSNIGVPQSCWKALCAGVRVRVDGVGEDGKGAFGLTGHDILAEQRSAKRDSSRVRC